MRISFRLSRDTRSVTVSYRMMYYLMMHFKQTSNVSFVRDIDL